MKELDPLAITFAILTAILTLVLVAMVREGNPRAAQLEKELSECQKSRDDYRFRYHARCREIESYRLKNLQLANARIAIQAAIQEYEPVSKLAESIARESD